jgi:hypothetical protein
MVLGGYVLLSYICFFLLSSFCCLMSIQFKISSFYQSRNVLFLRSWILWFYLFVFMNIKPRTFPKVIRWRRRRSFSRCLRHRLLFLSLTGPAIISLKSQRSISIGWSLWNHRSNRGLSSWRASSSPQSDRGYYDGPRERHFYVPFLFSCRREYCDPSVKTFLQALRCRGILHQKMTSPVALQSIFSDRPISQYPPQAASSREICLK